MIALTLVVYTAVALAAFGLSYWAFRARTDHSAFIGLYLLFGFPSALLAISGVALLVTTGNRLGLLLLLLGFGLGLPLLSPIRHLFAAVTPMDADSPVDMTGLCLLLVTLAILIFSISMSSGPPDELPSVRIVDIVLQAAIEVVLAYAAVGFWFERSLRTATERLGIVRPTWRMAIGVIGGLVAAMVVYGIAGYVAQVLDPKIVGELDTVTNEMTAQVQNPIGALVLGASAGIGEEAIFRGALQPRYGIVLSSLVFALLHAPQYGFTFAIVGLFGVSVVLGIVRQRYGTTASMGTHALYNFLAVMAQAYL